MPASRPTSKATITIGEEFLYTLKAGPAGGRLRRPSSAGSHSAGVPYRPQAPSRTRRGAGEHHPHAESIQPAHPVR
jgi:hypothetical protein